MATTRVEVPLADCPLELVSVYNDRAEVTRRVKVQAEAASEVEVVVAGLTKSAEGDSVRVIGVVAPTMILEVSFDVRRIPREASAITATKDPEIQRLEQAITTKQGQIAVLDQSKSLIQSFLSNLVASTPAPNVPGPTPEAIKQGLDYYQSETTKLNVNLATASAELQELKDQLKERHEELRRTGNDKQPGESREVTVLVQPRTGDDASPASIEFSLVYIVTRAGWTPSYDIRVDSAAQTMSLSYFGLVRQNSGEDWTNCAMQLSTAVPGRGGIPGAPPKMMVQYKQPRPKPPPPAFGQGRVNDNRNRADFRFAPQARMAAPMRRLERQTSMDATEARAGSDSDSEEADEAGGGEAQAGVKDGGSVGHATFTIERLVNIASDNKPHKVTVATIPLTPHFIYFATPSLEELAYLQARATNQSQYKLLASTKVSVFFDGGFVTTTSLKDISPGEEIMTFLGADTGVKVEFKRLKTSHQESTGFLSTDQVTDYQFKHVITNNKRVPAKIKIVGILPRSGTDAITVDLVSPAGKDLLTEKEAEAATGPVIMKNEVTNNVVWVRTLAPGEKVELPLRYAIRFPKGKEIEVAEGA